MTCTIGHKRSQTKPDRSHPGQHDQSFAAACLSPGGGHPQPEMSSNPETSLRGSSILLSFKNTGVWGQPPPSRWQAISLQNPFTGEVRVGEGGIRRRKGASVISQRQEQVNCCVPPHTVLVALQCRGCLARAPALSRAGGPHRALRTLLALSS